MRRLLAAGTVIAVGALLVGSQGGILAFNAGTTNPRTGSARVVPNASAYDAIQTFVISSALAGYTNQEGVRITNNGKLGTTFTWTTTANPNGAVNAATQCAANTAVGATCKVFFSGPVKLAGTYTFTGKVDGSGSAFRSNIPNIVVTVKYCALPPC